LARSSRDWYQLLEVCGLLATLIGDADVTIAEIHTPAHHCGPAPPTISSITPTCTA
jgi:hypothetical protein